MVYGKGADTAIEGVVCKWYSFNGCLYEIYTGVICPGLFYHDVGGLNPGHVQPFCRERMCIIAGAAADFIVVNMVAEAASGKNTPKEAAERAQKRAERYYKV